MLAYGSADAAGYHGRRTYELFAALWPSRAGEAGYIDRINALPKYVAGDADLRWARRGGSPTSDAT